MSEDQEREDSIAFTNEIVYISQIRRPDGSFNVRKMERGSKLHEVTESLRKKYGIIL